MRRYIIDVHGDNDDLHERALDKAVQAVKGMNNGGVISAVVVGPEPPEVRIPPVRNCVRRVK